MIDIENRLNIFEQFDFVDAFFTRKNVNSKELLPLIAENLNEGEYLVKAMLVHGKDVQKIDEDYLKDKEKYIEVPATDALVTNLKGVSLVTTHGDCIPVFACDPVKGVVGVAHAGWKGTMLGIAAELIKSMVKEYSCSPCDIYAFIGPGIGKCHFEVKDDVKGQFELNVPWSCDFIERKDDEHYLIDLKGINERFLSLEGVSNIDVSEECTYCEEDKYFSYRRCGDKLRMAACITKL